MCDESWKQFSGLSQSQFDPVLRVGNLFVDNIRGNPNFDGNINVAGVSNLHDNINLHCNEILNINGANFCDDTYVGLSKNNGSGVFDISLNSSEFHIKTPARIFMNGKVDIHSDVSMNSDVEVSGNVLIQGRTDVVGDVSMNSDVEVSGNVLVQSRTDVVGDVSMNSDVEVGGKTLIQGRTDIVGDVSMNSDVEVGGNTLIYGRVDIVSDMSLNSELEVRDKVLIQSRMDVVGDVSLNSDLEVNGNTLIYGRVDIVSDVSMNSELDVRDKVLFQDRTDMVGDVSMNSDVEVGGNVLVQGRTDMMGDVSMNSDVEVSGNVLLQSRLDVMNDVSFNTNIEVSGNVLVKGNMELVEGVTLSSSLEVLGETLLQNRVDIAGDVSMNSKLEVSDKVLFQNRLDVVGDVSMNSELEVSDKLLVQGRTDMIDDVSMNSDLEVLGKLLVQDNLFVDKQLEVNESTQLLDTLTVNGNTTLHSNLNVNGNTTLQGVVGVGGDLFVDGSLNVMGGTTQIFTQEVEISNNEIVLNSNMTGNPPPSLTSGIRVNRGNEVDYTFQMNEGDLTFRVGEDGDTQAVATREDTPIDKSVMFWNHSVQRMDTSGVVKINGSNMEVDGNSIVSGNIAINRSSATERLDVEGNARIRGNLEVDENALIGLGSSSETPLKIGNTNGNNSCAIEFYDTNSTTRRALIGPWENRGLHLRASLNEPITFFTDGFNERMRITEDGNVGIGTDDPDAKLEVDGDVKFRSDPSEHEQVLTFRAHRTFSISRGSGGPATADLVLTSEVGGNKWAAGYRDGNNEVVKTITFGASDSDRVSVRTNLQVDGNVIVKNDLELDGRLVMSGDFGTGGSNGIVDGTGFSNMRLDTQNSTLLIGEGSNNTIQMNVIDTSSFSTGRDLVLNGGGGNVGIGTTGPDEKLEVDGNIVLRGDRRSLYVGGKTNSDEDGLRLHYSNTNEQAYFDVRSSNGTFNFRSNSTDGATTRMVLTGGGNVGIGTDDPDEKLDVSGNVLISGTISMNNITYYGYSIPHNNNSVDNADAVFLLHPNTGGNNECIGRMFYQRSSAHDNAGIVNIVSSTRSSGGTPRGFCSYEVMGDTRGGGTNTRFTMVSCDYNGVNYVALRYQGHGWAFSDIYFDGIWRSDGSNTMFEYHPTSDMDNVEAMPFGGSAMSLLNDRVFINESGNVGIGTTSPSERLHVIGNIVASGSINGSDDRIKHNEVFITNVTETLLKLRPQLYHKSTLGDDISGSYVITQDGSGNEVLTEMKKESGLIAQEIYYDTPELRHLVHISEDASGIEQPPDDYYENRDNPEIDPDWSNWGTTEAGVNYIGLIPYLIQGFKEQQKVIEEQQKQIDALYEILQNQN